eukprot:1507223-Amphidinium_carterae.1
MAVAANQHAKMTLGRGPKVCWLFPARRIDTLPQIQAKLRIMRMGHLTMHFEFICQQGRLLAPTQLIRLMPSPHTHEEPQLSKGMSLAT